jgi:hypothetical protein
MEGIFRGSFPRPGPRHDYESHIHYSFQLIFCAPLQLIVNLHRTAAFSDRIYAGIRRDDVFIGRLKFH